MSINKKLLEYADSKDISQRKFTKSIGLAEGVLRKGQNIGSQHLKKVRDKYRDLNMNWLLFDEGVMIHDVEYLVNEGLGKYDVPFKKYESLVTEIEHLKELIAAKNETIEVLKYKLGLTGKEEK